MNERNVNPLIIACFLVAFLIPCANAQQFLPGPVQEQSRDQYLTDSTHFFLGNAFGESWFNNKVYRVKSRNEANNVLTASDYEYDTLVQQWYEQRRYQGSFLNDTIRKLWQSWIYNPNNSEWLLADSIHFNIYGSPTMSWYKIWDPMIRKFTGGKLSEFFYNDQGILHLTYNHYFDTLSENWKKDYYEVVHYNTHNLDSLRQLFKWNGAGWTDSLRISFTYDDKMEPDEEVQQLWTGNAWQNDKKWKYELTGGMLNELYEYTWQEALQEWMFKEFSDYSYTPGMLLEQVTDYLWDGSEWLNKTRKTYTYDRDELIEEILNEFWSFGNEAWINASLNTYAYDQHGNRTEFSFYTWDNYYEKWINFYREKNFLSFYPSPSVREFDPPQFELYPNPTRGQLQIKPGPDLANSKVKLLMVYSMDGRLMKTVSLSGFNRLIDISNLPVGTYRVILKTDKGISGRLLVISG